jgi:hypothetical protein
MMTTRHVSPCVWSRGPTRECATDQAYGYGQASSTHDGVIAPTWVRTTEMPADFLTKRLPREAFERCREQCGMTPLPEHVSSLIAPPCGARRGVLESRCHLEIPGAGCALRLRWSKPLPPAWSWLPQSLTQPKPEDRVLSLGGEQAQWPQPGSSGLHRQTNSGSTVFLHTCCSPALVLLVELSSQADVLACSPMHAAAGLSHRLFPAITWSPLCLLWLACAGPTAARTRARVCTPEDTRTRFQSQSGYPWLHPVMGFIAIV